MTGDVRRVCLSSNCVVTFPDPPLCGMSPLYGWDARTLSRPGEGTQSWLFCPLISLGMLQVETTLNVPAYTTGPRAPVPPLLFSLGRHRALVAVQSKLKEDEKLFAFLDDVYVTCTPTRVEEVFQLLETELHRHACISIHLGKTKLWNAAGIEPTGAALLSAAARRHNPQAVVWRGDQALPTVQQGLKVLGAPVGHPNYVKAFMSQKGVEHDQLLEMIPPWPRCAGSMVVVAVLRIHQSQFLLEDSGTGMQVFKCLSKVLQTDTLHPHHHVAATMPLTLGGLGLGNAQRARDATHWGSWADSLEMIRARHPEVASRVVRGLVTRS